MYLTDLNNNPTAMTTDVAAEGGLQYGPDYDRGTIFSGSDGRSYYIASFVLGDPVPHTIQVIDKIGFFTKHGQRRWSYVNLPKYIWDSFTDEQKRDFIGFMYQNEGGEALRSLFPNYGKS